MHSGGYELEGYTWADRRAMIANWGSSRETKPVIKEPEIPLAETTAIIGMATLLELRSNLEDANSADQRGAKTFADRLVYRLQKSISVIEDKPGDGAK